jgi:cell division protein FtsX
METPPRNKRHLIIAMLYFGLAAFFSLSFYDRFWSWRHEIDEVKSSYLTPEGANVTSSGMFWAVPAILFLLAGVWRTIRLNGSFKRKHE